MSDHSRFRLLKTLVFIMFFLTLGNAHAGTPVVVDLITFAAHIEGKDYRLEAKIYKPEDSERHPAVVMTHGRAGPTPARNPQEVNNHAPICAALATKGYVVAMVVRRGYGNSDGYGFWDSGEYRNSTVESGLVGAKDLEATVKYLQTRPDVLQDKIAIMGHSQGGWIALASSTIDIPGVRGVVNFSGATNFRNAQGPLQGPGVEYPHEEGSAVYGKDSKVPALWLYANRDTHSMESVSRWFATFKGNGGQGRLAFVKSGRGHSFIADVPLYIDSLLQFFGEIGI